MKVQGSLITAGQGARRALLLAMMILASVLLATPGSASAAGLALPPPCIARQAAGDSAERLLADPARFDCRRPVGAWGPGDYWVLYRLSPDQSAATAPVDGSPPILRIAPQWQSALTVMTRDTGGRILSRRYDDHDLGAITAIGDHVPLILNGHDLPLREILLRVDGALNARGIIVNPVIVTHEEIAARELTATAIYAAFAGLGIGLLFYNIVLWLAIRERLQLTYCLSLVAMLAYVWATSGAMTAQFPGVSNTQRLTVTYVMIAFAAALALRFFTDFIEPGKIPARLRRASQAIGLACVTASLLVVVAPADWLYLVDQLCVLSFMPLPVLIIAMSIEGWRRGSRAIRVLAIAWALPTIVAAVRILHGANLIPFSPFVQYSLIAGMSVEALLSSLAMSFRIKLITDERDRALADERAARHLASIDPLTGLLNRRALLEQVIDWSSPEPVRLLLVDIDQFKLVNDRLGHLTGDEVLREVAEVLAIRADLRASVARLGGEEFALIGTAAELHEGVALGILADMRGRLMLGHVPVTVSIGMADGPVRSDEEWRELYRRADAALYEAKASGRNRAVHAGPAGTEPSIPLPRRALAAG